MTDHIQVKCFLPGGLDDNFNFFLFAVIGTGAIGRSETECTVIVKVHHS